MIRINNHKFDKKALAYTSDGALNVIKSYENMGDIIRDFELRCLTTTDYEEAVDDIDTTVDDLDDTVEIVEQVVNVSVVFTDYADIGYLYAIANILSYGGLQDNFTSYLTVKYIPNNNTLVIAALEGLASTFKSVTVCDKKLSNTVLFSQNSLDVLYEELKRAEDSNVDAIACFEDEYDYVDDYAMKDDMPVFTYHKNKNTGKRDFLDYTDKLRKACKTVMLYANRMNRGVRINEAASRLKALGAERVILVVPFYTSETNVLEAKNIDKIYIGGHIKGTKAILKEGVNGIPVAEYNVL